MSDPQNSTTSSGSHWLRKGASEAKAVASETMGGTKRAAGLALAIVKQKQMDSQVREAQHDLGSEMVKHQIGEERFRKQIAELEDRMQTILAANGNVKALKIEMRGLKVRLAEPLTTSNHCPTEVSSAFEHYRQVRDQAAVHRAHLEESRRNLAGSGGPSLVRFGVGVTVCVVGLGFASWLWLAPSKAPAVLAQPETKSGQVISLDDEAGLKEAVGMVVCGLHVTNENGVQSEVKMATGTCFAITPDGYLLTNKHVVEEIANLKQAKLKLAKLREKMLDVKPTVWVLFGKEKYDAEIKHVSSQFDLAILKIERPVSPFLRLQLSPISRGKLVYAIGFPGAAAIPLSQDEAMREMTRTSATASVEDTFKKRDLEFTQTNGTVSKLAPEENGIEWVQHNASINPGNSGGPLVTDDALVVGINTLANTKAAGIFFALSFPQLKKEILKSVPGLKWD